MSFLQQDYDELFQRFDFNDDGSVNYDEMLTGLRVTTSCLFARRCPWPLSQPRHSLLVTGC